MGTNVFPVIDMVATGKNIVRLRQARGLSVSDVQKYFGFDAPQAIYKWQKGQTLPSVDNLLALSYLFEVPMDELLIQREPRFQILPQDSSCGSGRFGKCLMMRNRISLFHYLHQLITKGAIIVMAKQIHFVLDFS